MSQSQLSGDEDVELWYSRCGAATASAIAIRKNWLQAEFARGGTRLRSLRDSNDRAVLDSHYHHGLTGLFREGGNIPPIWARANGAQTAVVGITWLDEYQGILSRSDSGIRELPDLLGKRLGLPLHGNLIDFQRGAALHGFSTALGLIGAPPSEVRFVDIPAQSGDSTAQLWDDAARRNRPSVEVDALLSGKVDAIFLRSTRGARLAQDPRFFQIINIDKHPDPFVRVNNGTPRPITVDRRFLEEHPELVARYLAVLLRTAAWAETNPSEVVELLVSETGALTPDEVRASHGPDVHRAFWPELCSEYIEALRRQKNFLRDAGFLKADFEVDDWIERGPLALAEQLVEREPALFLPQGSLARESKWQPVFSRARSSLRA